MIQEPFTITEQYITCPRCRAHNFRVGHLPARTTTTWICHGRDCLAEFRVRVLDDGRIDTELTGTRGIPCLVTLRSEKPVTIIIRHIEYRPEADRNLAIEQTRYYYDEGTCQTNFLGVEDVTNDSGEEDPHGIFKFVKMEVEAQP